MTKKIENYEELLAYVRRLQNPYAWLGVLDDPDMVRDLPAIEFPSSPQQARLQNRVPNQNRVRNATISKAAFQATCRNIFCQYIPRVEGRQIRDHHRQFILRNESRSPEQRYRLVSALRRYDLSDLPGVTTQFNRERDPFTEDKLRKLEQRIDEDGE